MKNQKLNRVVKRNELLALSFGAMIGWSWVALTGNWISTSGTLGAIIAFLLGGVVVTFVGLTYAELASAIPEAGGEHVYSLRALGSTAAFVCTWSILFGYISVVAFEAVAFPTVLSLLLPSIDYGYLWTFAGWDVYLSWVLTGVFAAVLIALVNYIGLKLAVRFQFIMLVIIVCGGLILIFGASHSGSVENLAPLFVGGSNGIVGVIIMVPFMFVGFDVIAQSAEEIDLPFQQIGKVMIISIVGAIIWYASIIWAVSMALDDAMVTTSKLPTSDAASVTLNSALAGKIIVLAGIGGLLTSWNAFLVGGSRAIYAMAKAGQLPAIFAELHPKYRTPHYAIFCITFISALAPLLGRPALVWFVNAGAFGIVVAYIFVAISFMVLRLREPLLERPFKVKRWRIIGSAALTLSMGLFCLYLPGSPASLLWPYEWAMVILWILLGTILFLFNRRADSDVC